MRIFLSWSGTRSLETAKAWRDWLPRLFPQVDPWISEQIKKGDKWYDAIRKNLDESYLGLAIVTSDNAESAWLHYECGVIEGAQKTLLTFLLDVGHEEIRGPLSTTQHTTFKKADILKFCEDLNVRLGAAGGQAYPVGNLQPVFEKLWPQLELSLSEIHDSQPHYTQRAMLEEINTRVSHIMTWLYGSPMSRDGVLTWGAVDYGPPYFATVEDVYRMIHDPEYVPYRLRQMFEHAHWDGKAPYPWEEDYWEKKGL